MTSPEVLESCDARAEQIEFYREQGYLLVEDVIDPPC